MNRVLPTEIFYQPTDLSEAWVLVPHRQGLTMFCGKSHKSPDIVGGRVRTEQQENISSPGIKHTFLKGNKTCHVPAIRQLRVVSPCIAARVVLFDADRWHYRLFDVDRFVGTGPAVVTTHIYRQRPLPHHQASQTVLRRNHSGRKFIIIFISVHALSHCLLQPWYLTTMVVCSVNSSCRLSSAAHCTI